MKICLGTLLSDTSSQQWWSYWVRVKCVRPATECLRPSCTCSLSLPLSLSLSLSDWAAQNYPKPRTTTAEWLHKIIDRNVSPKITKHNTTAACGSCDMYNKQLTSTGWYIHQWWYTTTCKCVLCLLFGEGLYLYMYTIGHRPPPPLLHPLIHMYMYPPRSFSGSVGG